MTEATNPDAAPTREEATLARTMGLGALVIYGVGDMLGSGIYALIGKAAKLMGNAVWLAFGVSMVAALLTGLSYASLGSRYPRAAGVAFISQRAFGKPFLSFVLGLAVVASGLTSMATQSRAFSGYFLDLAGLPSNPGMVAAVILAFIFILTFVNFWGMRESTWLNAVCTTIEVSGLAIVVAVAVRYWGGVNYLEVPPPSSGEAQGALTASLVFQGAVLTFYSFIGFEDMINVSEEVKDPRRTFPLGVMIALSITTVIYLAVSVSAISVVPYATLGDSKAPLVDVVKTAAPAFPPFLFSYIALFAITNTALLNYIMGSRLIYGMARQGFLPRPLAAVHPQRRTPHLAILVLMIVVTVLALSGQIAQLASATSVLLLTVFVFMNAALIVLKRRTAEPHGAFEIPAVIPAGGIVVCTTLLCFAQDAARMIALGLLAFIAVVYALVRPKNITEETLTEAVSSGQ
jgi:basic amino acid/polyamine antiporter, APA family